MRTWLLTLACSGCLTATPPDGAFVCGAGNACPEGYRCGANHTCTRMADAAGCPADMVRVDSYCVDRTEVTQGAYKTFLATNPTTSVAACAGVTLTPQDITWPPPAGTDQLPVGGVNWCGAYAYCASVGKRICGKIGGGSLGSVGAGTDFHQSQWYNACSNGGAHNWPYGDTYIAGVCKDGISDNGPPAPVGSLTGCEGGLPGLFDMSGNVMEWEDLCDSTNHCARRGGGFSNADGTTLACNFVDMNATRDSHNGRMGIRCCKD